MDGFLKDPVKIFNINRVMIAIASVVLIVNSDVISINFAIWIALLYLANEAGLKWTIDMRK